METTLVLVACAVMGLVVGSFLTVVVDRVPRGGSVVEPPSACGACGHRLTAPDLVPIASWLALRGECRHCSNPIGNEPLIIEIANATLFVLFGLKFGAAKRFANDWEVASALGVAFSLVGSDKVREHALFLDVEANKYASNGVFVGTGLSLWDLTRKDTFTPAWMLHFGVPLGKHAVQPYFLTEGRLFLDKADDMKNNYQFWAGVRVHF